MGMRIHKSLGYGLDLNQIENPNLTNLQNFDFLEEKGRFDRLVTEMIAELEQTMSTESLFAKIGIRELKKREKELYEWIIYNEEFGLNNIVQFIPIGHSDWKRYDNIIDYYEEGMKNNNLEPHCKWSNRAIYPYLDLMKINDQFPYGIEKYWTPLYMDDEELSETAIPFVPMSVYFMLKELQIVPDEKLAETYMKLRPCIYTYWS